MDRGPPGRGLLSGRRRFADRLKGAGGGFSDDRAGGGTRRWRGKALPRKDVVKEVPDARYMVLDTRIREGADATTEESARILRSANLVFDTVRGSGVPVIGPNGAGLQDLIDTFGKDKLAFGSETPFCDYVTPFLRIEVYPGDSATKELIWHGNARRILGMA